MTVTLEFFQTYHFVIGLLSAYNSTFFRYVNQAMFFSTSNTHLQFT